MNIVIYTCILGNYDNLKEPKIPQSAKMVLFTDKDIDGGSWNVIKWDGMQGFTRNARWLKTHSDYLFPDADITIWVDGSFELTSDLGAIAEDVLKNDDIAMYSHPSRDCIYDELKACIKYNKDDEYIMQEQLNRYKDEGYPSKNGLIASGLIFRRNSKSVELLNKSWWQEINYGSYRDQLSFNYCQWKLGLQINIISGSIYNNNLVKLNPNQHHNEVMEKTDMKRTDVIKELVKNNDYRRYLEIGVRSGHNFRAIPCPFKIGVDPDKRSRATHFMTSDEFFENNTETFDIIFIDGDHEEHQVMKDVLNSLEVLSPSGSIVMHDCNPIDEWSQRPFSEFKIGEKWNGTVWRAYVELRKRPDLSMYVIDTDEGAGVIQRGSQKPITYQEPLHYKELENRRDEMLNLISPEEWKNRMNTLIDVILIKYCLTKEDELEWDKTYLWLSNQENVNVITRDNTDDNIGLVKARIELIEQSKAEYVCFIDFDFKTLDIDLIGMSQMLEGDVAAVIPSSKSNWGLKNGYPCNCVVMKRRMYESLGGYDDRYFVAYADWDLFSNIWNVGMSIARHESSKLSHNGSSNKNPHKRQLWEKDRQAYVDKWSTVYQGMKNDKILLSNPDGVECGAIVLGLQENAGEIHMFTGVHDLNFWHSEFFRYDKFYHLPSIYRDNYNIVNACKQNDININLMLSNSAIIVIPYRNCEKFIGECIDSITSQTWKDLGVILIDDDSDDNTMQEAMSKLNGKVANIYVKNKERQWALKNIDYAISNFCADYNSVIFLVDGDDKLNSPTAIEEMMTQHLDNDLVWSSYVTSQAGVPSCCGSVDDNREVRKQPWKMSHLRSFKKFLFDAIDRDEFKEDNGEYLKYTWDRAIMCPIAEMTPPNKRRHYPKPLYWYRFHQNNVHVSNRNEQVRIEKLIHSRPSVGILERYKKKVLDITVVVSCFNQLYVLPKFLEAMFFQTQLPKEVIVADDGSSDGVCEWVEENAHRYPFKLSYVTREHKGYRLASLNNLAASVVDTVKILFTNADVLHSPSSIKAHTEAEGVVGGVIVGISTNRAEKITIEDVRDYNHLSDIQKKSPSGRHNLNYIKTTNPQVNPIGVWGGNFSVPADKFHEANGFDEGFKGWGGEDNELVIRLIKAGCKVEWAMNSEACHLDHENKKYAYDQSGSNYYLRKLNG